MALNWNELDDAAYQDLRWKLIANVEENGNPKSTPYLDGKGIPTIGVGFNITDKTVRDTVLSYLGFKYENGKPVTAELPYIDEIINILDGPYIDGADQESALRQALDDVMARRAFDPAITWADRSTFQYMFDSDIRKTFDDLIGVYDNDQVNEWFPGIPNSRERTVLVSLAYNAMVSEVDDPSTSWNEKHISKLLGDNLWNAIYDGDRARAWFEIRYASNGDKLSGIEKRRYYESQIFGLFDNPGVYEGTATVSDNEADAIIKFLYDPAVYGNVAGKKNIDFIVEKEKSKDKYTGKVYWLEAYNAKRDYHLH